MPNPKNNNKKQSKPGLRMNELMAATGLPRSTLIHWIKEGLLPKPIRINRTMAYYNQACVERASFISKLKNQDMPLNKIKKAMNLKDKGLDINPLVDLHQMIFSLSEKPRLTLKEYCEATGLSRKQVRDLMDSNLLIPQKKKYFDNEDISIGLFFSWGIREGINPKDLEYLYRDAERSVKLNVELSLKITKDKPFEKAAEVKIQLMNSLPAVSTYLRKRILKKRVSTKEHSRRSFTDERLWRGNEEY
jgi:DNA-binding transcriptional MerR regulator